MWAVGSHGHLQVCWSKAKELRRSYKLVKEGTSQCSRTTMPFFSILTCSSVRITGWLCPPQLLRVVQWRRCATALRDTGEELGSRGTVVLALLPFNYGEATLVEAPAL